MNALGRLADKFIVYIRDVDRPSVHGGIAQVDVIQSRSGDDSIEDVAIVDGVIDTAHGQLLWDVPVLGGEIQLQRSNPQHALGSISAVEPQRHVLEGLAVENDVEGSDAAGFGGDR